MTATVRLSVRAPTSCIDSLESRLLSLLQRHGLAESVDLSRAAADGIRRHTFAADSACDATARMRCVQSDPQWNPTGYPASCQVWLDLCEADAGSGRTVAIGRGVRQGAWRAFDTEDGLPSSTVSAIVEDDAGMLWIGTEGGLCRFDGAELTIYTTDDGLPHDGVVDLHIDRASHLWLTTGRWNDREGGAICRYDGRRFVTFSAADGLPGRARGICESSDGALWFATFEGVHRLIDDRLEVQAVRGLPDDRVHSLYEGADGVLWVGTASGVACFDGGRMSNPIPDEPIQQRNIRAFLNDRSGPLWLAANEAGLFRCEGKRLVPHARNGELADGIRTLCQDDDGDLWLATETSGVQCWGVGRSASYTTDDGLGSNQVNAILQDSRGLMWFACSGGGLTRFDGRRVVSYTQRHGLANNGVMAVQRDRLGQWWFATHGGVSRFDGVAFHAVDACADANVWAVLQDRLGRMWFGLHEIASRAERRGIVRLDDEGIRCFDERDGLVGEHVTCAHEDRAGNLWFGTDGGLEYFDSERFKSLDETHGLPASHVLCVLGDKDGSLWFGTTAGLCRYDGRVVRTWTVADGLACDRVWGLHLDADGTLWVATWGGGVSRFDGETFETFSRENGLAHDDVVSIMRDRSGHLWFGTFGGGISRFDGTVFQTLSRKDGLASNSVHQMQQDDSGDVWIATEAGVTRYRPCDKTPTVRVEAIIGDRRYDAGSEIRIPSSQHLLAIEVQGASFTTPADRMAFVFRLHGVDEAWRTAYEPHMEYYDLAPGDYRFEVQAVDRDLNRSTPVEVTFSVVVDPLLQAWKEAVSGEEGEFVGRSAALRRVEEELAQAAVTDLTILIMGETGTGKGLASRRIHALSPRRNGPLIHVNCGAIPAGLVESELFGHEQGAFTGAVTRKLGKVEVAAGGTLLLDEIGDMPQEAQTKLLRLLEEGAFERVGGHTVLRCEARIVASTNRDLEQMVAEGSFREDLYYRLRVFPVSLPPLRDRREDIPELATYFAAQMATHLHKVISSFDGEAMAALQNADWPGNVRELEHLVRRAVVVCPGSTIRRQDVSLPDVTVLGESVAQLTPAEYERRYLIGALERCGWVIKGPNGAARMLDMPPATLRARMKRFDIQRPG